MGSYTFTWAHAATEVFVTGDFDDWKQSIKLEKVDGVFQKTVELPKATHHYKFVVDGNWVTNETHHTEDDGKGNYNNVLRPDEIKDDVSTLSSAAPESTTAALAGTVPKEDRSKSEESIPGSFPLTPPAATPGSEPQAFSVNPIPATAGLGNPISLAPGEKVPEPSTLTSNTIDSTVKHDKEPEEEANVSVAPIPATAGAGNPIHLAPGEKVPEPSSLTANTITSTATTDKASYDKSTGLPPQLGPVVTPEVEREAKGGMFSLPPLAGSLIPESSLPNDTKTETEKDPGFTIQSAAPTSTTAALAGEVPKEPRGVPTTVTESQKEAGFKPEASANAEAVAEKKEVEQELKDKVPVEPATTESPTVAQQVGATAVAGATAAAGAFAAATYAAKEKAAQTIGVYNQAPADAVPDVVAESQKEAHVSPEASANPEAVQEKKEVESELLQGLGKSSEASAPAAAVPAVVGESQKQAHVAPEASANPEAVEEKKAVEAELLKGGSHSNATGALAAGVPAVVGESQKEAHVGPEAAANAEAVEEKKEVEAELLKEVKTTTESGDPAPTVTAATSATAPGLSDDSLVDSKPLASSSEPDALNASAAKPAVPETSKPAVDSRDVSPMSKQPTTATQTQPAVTTGVESSKAEAKSAAAPETPKKETATSAKGTPESVASGATDKKKKRTSIFGKLKAKLSSKN